MTVQEVINELNKIENKNKKVFTSINNEEEISGCIIGFSEEVKECTNCVYIREIEIRRE